jgi:hypothetical protein
MAAVMGSDEVSRNLGLLACCGLDFPSTADLESLRKHFFGIHIHGFMDQYTFDVERAMKCCIHQLLPDGRAIPLCAYNILGYRERTRCQGGACQ